MGVFRDFLKRSVVGRPLPIFASDPLSSVAYATQEILLVLSVGGTAYLYLTPYLAAAVVLLLTIVVASYASSSTPTRLAEATTRSPTRTSGRWLG